MDSPTTLVQIIAGLGFMIAFIFGIVGNKTNFCTMGAVSDIINMGDWGRMRAWLLAIAVAVIGTNLLAYTGQFDITKTIYTQGNRLFWLATLGGGFIFGIGMTLASGCGQKTLVRAGGGNLRSIVVFLFFGYSALVTLRGLLALVRINVFQADAVAVNLPGGQTVPMILAVTGLTDVRTAELAVALALGLALLAFCFSSKEFRHSFDNMLAGFVIGAIVIAGWYITGKLGYVENPDTMEMTFLGTNSHLAESLTFAAPTAYTMEFWALWTDQSNILTFGVATSFGVLAGSFFYALISRSFRWEAFSSAQDMFRHIIGALLMGFGGITAFGCTIGQGITGVSTLSVGSFLTFFGIVFGSALTMKVQYHMLDENHNFATALAVSLTDLLLPVRFKSSN